MENYEEVEDYDSIVKRCESKELKLADIVDKPTRPFKRPYKNASEEKFHMWLLENQPESKNAMHYSKSAMNRLKPIQLNEMMVNKVHSGHYLLCRAVSEFSVCNNCLLGFVEDENGDRIEVELNNYVVTSDASSSSDDILASVFAIKEPYIRIARNSEQGSVICVSSPTDVVMIYDNKLNGSFSRLDDNQDYEHLQREGNIYFIAKRYHKALDFYQRALAIRKTKTILLNVSAAFMALNNHWQAYLHAKQSLSVDDGDDDARREKLNEEKARFRMASALYAMRQWSDAIESYEKCLEVNASNKEAANGLKMARERMNESRTGVYDLKDLFKRVYLNREADVMVGEYVSDQVEIRDITKRNKGVFAISDISPGTLLVVSKAVALFDEPTATSSSLMLATLAQRLQSNPHLAKDFYALYAGDKFNRNDPVPAGLVDTHRAYEIYRFNTFSNTNLFKAYKVTDQLPLGLWIYPARLNHSCLPNVVSIYFNDIMFMYASKPIKAGDELTDSYVPADLPYPRRRREIEKCGFTCTCALCQLDKSELELCVKREELITSILGELKMSSKVFDKQIDKFKSLYGTRDKYRYDLATLLTILAGYYQKDGNLKRSATLLMELSSIQADYYPMNAMETAMEASRLFRASKMEEKARECLERALALNIFYDRDTFTYLFHRYLIV